jgi:hypothetical protein
VSLITGTDFQAAASIDRIFLHYWVLLALQNPVDATVMSLEYFCNFPSTNALFVHRKKTILFPQGSFVFFDWPF